MLQSRSWYADLLLVLLILCTSSCREEIDESPVPDRRVRYSCTIDYVNIYMEQGDPQVPLGSIGGYVRCYDSSKLLANEAWGTGGLLLVHGFSDDRYYAYDLACPYCYAKPPSSGNKLHRLTIDSDGATAVCETCQSAFGSIFWGSPAPTKGPANQSNYPLRQYRASQVGDNLVVSN